MNRTLLRPLRSFKAGNSRPIALRQGQLLASFANVVMKNFRSQAQQLPRTVRVSLRTRFHAGALRLGRISTAVQARSEEGVAFFQQRGSPRFS